MCGAGGGPSELARRHDVRCIADYYSAHAETYQALWAPALLPASDQLLRQLPLVSAERILDLGSGIGSLLPALHAAAPRAVVTAADRSEGMIRCAPSEELRVAADAVSLPFGAGSFDVAVLAFMLFHAPDPLSTLREVRRVLPPGGSIGLTTWGRDMTPHALKLWNDELDRCGAPPEDPLPALHDQMDSVDKLAGLLVAAGFDDVAVAPIEWAFMPDLDQFVERQARQGVTSRRLAHLPPQEQEAFLARIRTTLAPLPANAFWDTSEVLAAKAVAP